MHFKGNSLLKITHLTSQTWKELGISHPSKQDNCLYISNLNRTEMSQNELPLHLRSWIFILCFKYLNKKQYLIFACASKC